MDSPSSPALDIATLDNLLRSDQTLAVLAHELKNPLSLIHNLSLALLDDQLELSDELRQRFSWQIVSLSDQALKLATNLSKCANLEQISLDLSPLDPVEVCAAVKQEVETAHLMGSKRKISLKAGQAAYLAVADSQLLRAIIHQFCLNALNYADQQESLELKVGRLGRRVRVSVRDFGPRLPLDVWRSLRDSGNDQIKVQKVTSRPLSSGLGIYITQRFAEEMGARIGAISHQDGTTFFVDLPYSSQLNLFERV